MEHDPLKFNNLLYLWNEIAHKIVIEDPLDRVEQEISQFVRNQQTINELKKQVGCD